MAKQWISANIVKRKFPERRAWCRLTKIWPEEKMVIVEIEGLTEADGRPFLVEIPFERFFLGYEPAAERLLRAYRTAIAFRDDYLRQEWPFVVAFEEADASGSCAVSRKSRIEHLWQEVDAKARATDPSAQLVQAQITGGSKDHILGKIEGNLNVRIARAEVEEFLQASIAADAHPAWRFFIPEAGDSLWGTVRQATREQGYVLLDVVSPLRTLEQDNALFWHISISEPPATASDAALPSVTPFPAREPPAPRHKIWVAENDPAFLQTVLETLEMLGYRPMGFASAREVLDLVSTGEWPHLFLLDINLTDVSGVELAARLEAVAGP